LAITEHFNRTMPDVNFACDYTIEVVGSHVVDFAARVSAARSLWGAALRRTMFDTTTAPASASSAKLFRSSTTGSSCTTPSAVAHVLFGHHDNDQRLIDHSTGKVREIVRAADGEDGWDVNRTAHLMGTCRMGIDPRASVVDGNGRSHDVPNLFILRRLGISDIGSREPVADPCGRPVSGPSEGS
jgi:choline dehydrogenase-like flavoprotein